ncbi:hypothetical protein [Magnetococcus sp. PR-3]|uniref:hypothetical protein n=1 Tax=Magnetococcus sp. PR-3 TaxID=3120355 RepID=UPI002FCE16B1
MDRSSWVKGLLATLFLPHKNRPGQCLSPETVAQFAEQSLEGEPRQQVISHLAHCERCYTHWSTVMEMREDHISGITDLSSKRHQQQWRSRFKIGWQSWSVGGVAAAAALWFVVLQPAQDWRTEGQIHLTMAQVELSGAKTWPWLSPQSPAWRGPSGDAWHVARRGGATREALALQNQALILAFAAGVRERLDALSLNDPAWMRLRAFLPDLQQRPKSVGTTSAIEPGFISGQWAMMVYLGCHTTPAPDQAFWQAMQRGQTTIVQGAASGEGISFYQTLQQATLLQDKTPNKQLCKQATYLLDALLKPQP